MVFAIPCFEWGGGRQCSTSESAHELARGNLHMEFTLHWITKFLQRESNKVLLAADSRADLTSVSAFFPSLSLVLSVSPSSRHVIVFCEIFQFYQSILYIRSQLF